MLTLPLFFRYQLYKAAMFHCSHANNMFRIVNKLFLKFSTSNSFWCPIYIPSHFIGVCNYYNSNGFFWFLRQFLSKLFRLFFNLCFRLEQKILIPVINLTSCCSTENLSCIVNILNLFRLILLLTLFLLKF